MHICFSSMTPPPPPPPLYWWAKSKVITSQLKMLNKNTNLYLLSFKELQPTPNVTESFTHTYLNCLCVCFLFYNLHKLLWCEVKYDWNFLEIF